MTAPARKKSEQRRRQRAVAVRLTEAEYVAIRGLAEAWGCSMPELLRRSALPNRFGPVTYSGAAVTYTSTWGGAA